MRHFAEMTWRTEGVEGHRTENNGERWKKTLLSDVDREERHKTSNINLLTLSINFVLSA